MSALTSALARVDPDELIALTRDLVRIPSVVRPGDPTGTEAAVADHVEQWLREEGFDVEVQSVAPGRPNVLAVLGERAGGPTLLLEGHTDVATEGDPGQWSHRLRRRYRRGPHLGRGAADMKSGWRGHIAAAALKRSGARLAGRLVVGALVDEEAECSAPSTGPHAARRELTAAIICEPEQRVCLSHAA